MSEYKTAKGRVVYLSEVSISSTYAGQREGSPETISRHILKDLSARLKEMVPGDIPVLSLSTGSFPLPPYLWIAKFSSRQGVKNIDPDFNSELAVCWFADGTAFDKSVNDIIVAQLARFDWDLHATDYDITDF